MDYPLGNIHAFDFDGTLTRRDTLLEFIRFAKGDKHFLLCMLRFLPKLVAMKAGLYHNGRMKREVFSYCFKGMTVEAFNDLCRRFAKEKSSLLRQKGMQKVKDVLAEGGTVVIVSASVTNWVEPFFSGVGDVLVLGTMIEEREGVLTGRFATKNCYGKEKVTRLLQLYPERTDYHLTAYGDSKGDIPLLDFADEGHYKPFR